MTDIVHLVEAVSHRTTVSFFGCSITLQCRHRGRADFIIVGKVPRLSTSGTNCFFQYSTKHIHNVFYVLHKTNLI